MVTGAESKTDAVGESCSLDSQARTERYADLSEFWDAAVVGRQRTEDAVVLIYRDGDGVEAAARKFAAAEQECCPGFNISVERRGDEVLWNISLAESSDVGMLDAIWALTDRHFETGMETESSGVACGSGCGC